MVEHKLGVSIVGEDKASGPIRNVQSALVNLDKSAKTSAGGFNTLGAAAATAAGFIVAEIGEKAVSAVSDLTKEMVKLGLEQDRLATRSKNLYKNLGLEKYQKEIAKTIEQQSIMTGMDDEELLSSYNKLLAVTKDRTQATKLLALAQDMAAGSGENLESSTRSITNALMGQTRGLKRFGIDIEEDTFKATTFAGQIRMLEQEINKLYAGAAVEAGKSPAGIFAGFETAIENVKEMFGEELIESLAPTLKSITDTINELATSGKLDPLIESFGKLVTSGVKLAETVSKILMDIMGFQNSQQAVEWLTTTFERAAVAIDSMATSLERVRDIIAGLDLSRLQPLVNLLAGASNPGGLLGLITGDKALNDRIAKENTNATKDNTEAKEEETTSQKKVSEENMSAAEKLKLMKGTTQEVTAVTGAFGNAMGSAIGTISSAMRSLGGGGYSSGGGGCGGCMTYGTGTTIEGGGSFRSGAYSGGPSGSPGMLWYNVLGNENAAFTASKGESWANTVSNVKRNSCSGLVCSFNAGGATYYANDALIKKDGSIVNFHPDDNILAFKEGSKLQGKSMVVNNTFNISGSGDPDKIADEILKRINRITRVGF